MAQDASPTAPAPAPAASASTASPAPKEVVNDPSRTGFDPQMKWWMNYFRILSGQMTPEGQFHYREWRYKVHEQRDCKRCEDYRDWLFTYSPVVRFLSGKIQDLNGKLDASNVLCRRCPARLEDDGQVHRQSGGFSPNHGILICANEIRDRKHLEDTLAHEMVHAWDHLRWKVDWTGDKDLKHAACTEVSNTCFAGGRAHETSIFRYQRLTILDTTDSCIDAQRRVPLEQRSLHPRPLVSYPAVPKLRSVEGHSISHGSTEMQRRRASDKSG
jgi:inner membrane protease ATP23